MSVAAEPVEAAAEAARGGGGLWRTAARAWLSHWRRHPGQALTLILGLALATGLWTGVQAINAEARASYDRASAIVGQADRPRIVAQDGGAVAVADYVALRRAGWPVAPMLEGRARLAGRSVTLTGIDPLTMPVLPQGGDAAPQGGGDGLAAFVGPPGQLFAAPDAAEALEGRIAPELIASADVPPGQLIGDLSTVSRLLERPDTLSYLALLRPEPGGATLSDIAPALARAAPPQGAGIGGLADSFHLNLTAFGLLSFAVGLFIVHGAVGLAFEQRRGMLRTLRALGVPARVLTGIAAAELACIAVLAGAIGVALGYVIASVLLPGVAATLRGLYGAPAAGDLALRPGWIAAGFGMAALGTGIAAAQSLARLRSLPILAAARPRAWARAAAGTQAWQAGIGAALLLASLPLAWFGGSLTTGFAMIGAALGGAALLLPPFLSLVLAQAAARARRPVAQWFWADARQQLPGLSLALMALMLALATNIGVSTMVGSFRTTFADYLDQRLAAELYVAAATAEEADRLALWLAPRVDAVLPRLSTDATLAGRPGSVEALADHATYRDSWPMRGALPEAWDRLALGEGVLVNEQLAYGQGVGPADRVTLDGAPVTVLGVYADYGNPRPAAVLGHDAFTARYPDVPRTSFQLRLPQDGADALRTAMIDEFGIAPDRVIDQPSVKDGALAVFERTFAVTAALNALTLGVAAIALLTSFATLAGQRLPQVAPVWALGLTRAQLARLELMRTAALAALTCLAALPVGLGLAWALLAVVNVEAFGWRLPLHVFPADWARLAALAMVAALAAAALPAWRMATRPPAVLLKVFANDR